MLDIKLIRENPDFVRDGLATRNSPVDIAEVLALDERRRAAITEADQLKNTRNDVSRQIGVLKKAGQDTSEIQRQTREIGEKIAALDNAVREIEAQQEKLMLAIPNLPHASVPRGRDAADNVVVRQWGQPRQFDFAPQDHVAIGERLGLFDFDRAARIAGAGFPLFTGPGARLERALIQFMLDMHTTQHGYTEIAPPHLVTTAAMTGTGQLPKMADDMYHASRDDLWLIPTAEVPVTNLYRDEIIRAPLPLKYVAYTPCFRREAGSAGKETRGLIRVHQFDKVELVKFVPPETSYDELEALVRDVEHVLQTLELPYRVLQLCSGDMSFAAAKCYDIELWAPGHNGWLEDSSCSNFEAFQARRANIRWKNAHGKTEFVHTLNGSGLALSRLYVALLENGQQADGSVVLPAAIRPYMGGLERLGPPA
ncbi:MAG TPA: serine--tRNA ligase [Kiritimatiellia bacterium]|jgi:seryl-tRNA synthetase|nr:serine--tRNA ligase [Kiritimatiellia bacterium]HOE36635.1 serine--tRNA ligase [Kiritimatiellia bacterium]HOR74144.1 serine--tRNA ligase [Kiritimatiellia bacterium]HOU59665.1 serine--tRNA ligase [Kiritimatiellia bacterium]HPK69170.1 serine--tRNA ligase [Kiritimatiellia bacterium]